MNTRLDPVVLDLNRYLAQIDHDAARIDAISRRTAEMMTKDGGYSPADSGNFIEAINELAADEQYASLLNMIMARVDKAMDTTATTVDVHYQMIGLHLVGFLKDYWTKYARNRAETEIDDSCPHCFGKGCRKCEAPERDE